MNKTKKQKQDNEPTEKEKCQVGVVKYLLEALPDSLIDRIHVLTHVLQTQFRILSFAYTSDEHSSDKGKKEIDVIHKELRIFIDTLQLDLLKIWEEEEEDRKVKG